MKGLFQLKAYSGDSSSWEDIPFGRLFQLRNDGGNYQCGSSGGPEKWKDMEYILRVELIRFPEITGCVREI